MKAIVELLTEAYDAGVLYGDESGALDSEDYKYKRHRAIALKPLVDRLTKILDPIIWSGG